MNRLMPPQFRRPHPRPSRLYVPGAWHRDHRVGLTAVVVSVALIWLVGFLGPSAATLSLDPQGSLLPPYNLHVPVPDWVAVGLLWLALAVGAGGWWCCRSAAVDGWRPRLARLAALGVGLNVVVCLVPPMTSADVLMYAAYGRLQVLGLDPYQIPPGEIFRMQYDPVLLTIERPWQDTPTVYGPVISATQYAAINGTPPPPQGRCSKTLRGPSTAWARGPFSSISRNSVRTLGSSVVSQSCSGFISPRPL